MSDVHHFYRLLQLLEEKRHAAVFVDLDSSRPFYEGEFNWVTASIERTGPKYWMPSPIPMVPY
jgi:hypothetical protein